MVKPFIALEVSYTIKLTEKVAIVGVGMTRFGKREDADTKELGFEALKVALEDVPKLSKKDINMLVVGYAWGYTATRNPAGELAEYARLSPVPGFDVHAQCSSSTVATITGWSFIRSGFAKVVAAVGVQKMSELSGREVQRVMGQSADSSLEAPLGMSMPTAYALRAKAYMEKYGAKEEDLALIRVKASEYSSKNPYAMFRQKYTVDDVMKSRPVSLPLKLLDCAANADGAAAVILASEDVATKLTDTPVWIKGVGLATGQQTVRGVPDLTQFLPTVEATNMAYKNANIEPSQVQVAETHDCFTISEILDYEDMGFFPRGEGYRAIRDGQTYVGGKVAVNVSGGLLGRGHPVGATGAAQIFAITRWLRGDAVGDIRVPAELGVAYTRGGVGTYAAAVVLSRRP
jgi:acetyl-CoA C-acetyltransferase